MQAQHEKLPILECNEFRQLVEKVESSIKDKSWTREDITHDMDELIGLLRVLHCHYGVNHPMAQESLACFRRLDQKVVRTLFIHDRRHVS